MSNSFSRRAAIAGYDLVAGFVDPITIGAMKRWWFPSARIWASANGARGDADAVAANLPPRGQKRIRSKASQLALQKNESARQQSSDANAAWREVVIQGGDGDPAAAETTRRRAGSRHLAMHGPLAAAVGRRGVKTVAWAMEAPGALPPTADAFMASDNLESVQEGPEFREDTLMRRWLAAPAETGLVGDIAYARVSWPVDMPVHGVIVVGAGVGVEWDIFVRMRRDHDFAHAYTVHGLAVVELVSPGHGLRRADHLYGEESFFQSAPVSAGASLAAQVRETGRWIAWARRAFSLPVGEFGVSMSSFAAQLAISHCNAWPEAARPDAALLMAHSGDLIGVTQGSLSRGLGLPAAQKAAGWTAADFAPWGEALGPADKPAITPEAIVSITGRRDGVTPFRDGEIVRENWGIPPANRFTYGHGHMGLPFRVIMEPDANERFSEILRCL
jgi:hypothetical protein